MAVHPAGKRVSTAEVDSLYKFQFKAQSIDVIPIGDDPDNPTYITGLVLDEVSDGFSLGLTGSLSDEDTGAIVNNTGKDISMSGSFTYQPDNSGSTSRLQMWSETSTDGVSWVENTLSGRTMEVSSNAESTSTKKSSIINWASGEYLRFAVYDSGGGSVNFEPITISVNGGTDNVTSLSFEWYLQER